MSTAPIFDDATPSLGDFYRDEILPRLRPEQIYTDPSHDWKESHDRWRGACPWHRSQSGSSFVVSLGSLLWWCQGCGVGGGPIEYLWKQRGGAGTGPRGRDFVAIVRELADLAGVPFLERELTDAERQAAEERIARQSALETVYRACQDELWSDRGASARTYLHARGLGDGAIRDLELGLYPSQEVARAALRRAGHDPSVLTGAWPKLAGYVTFPWRDDRGYALTIYGRWPDKAPPDERPKTIALPGEGSKRPPLYFDRARLAGHTDLTLVEGVLDAAVAQARNLTDVVAYVGGAPSREQLETLKRHRVAAVTICPDPDSGGDTGIRSLLKHLGPSIRAYVAPRLPDGLDPDQLILRDGVEAWRAHIRQAVRGVVYSAARILEGADLTSAKGRDDALAELVSLAATASDDDREAVVDRAAPALGMKSAALLARVKRASDRDGTSTPGAPRHQTAGDSPYRATGHGLTWEKVTRDGSVTVSLTNFVATIVADVVEDDGTERRRMFEIEARLHGRVTRFSVAAEKFGGMGWATEHLGAGAVVSPGFGLRDHARAAIQLLSGDVPTGTVYRHTGFRQAGGTWAYRHGGGAIGPDGPVPGVEVSLPDALAGYVFPPPSAPADTVAAVRASLGMLDVAPRRITVPVFGAVYRAAVATSDCGLHLVGQTGAGKTEIAALAQQHYGPCLDARNLPASWSSTGNALEGVLFAAKDALVVIDDFCPVGGAADVQRYHRDADRVFRAQGNRSGRQRMRSDASLKPAKPPRGFAMSTGEDTPRGQSLRSRVGILEVGPSDVDWARLAACQVDAGSGLYAQSLVGFVGWAAARYDELRARMRGDLDALRSAAYHAGQHRRTPGIVADLAYGLKLFLAYAQDIGAFDTTEADKLWKEWWAALGEMAAAQSQHQGASEPTRRFLELLRAALASGRVHLAHQGGDVPGTPEAWGWRKVTIGGGDTQWRPAGERVGWVDRDGQSLYLEPDAAYAAVQRLARDGGDTLAVTGQTLWKRLRERGLLASVDERRQTLKIRRTFQRQQHDVLHLHSATLFPPTEPDKPDKEAAAGAPRAGRDAGPMSGLLSSLDTDPTPSAARPLGVPDADVGFVGSSTGVETQKGTPRDATAHSASGSASNASSHPTSDSTKPDIGGHRQTWRCRCSALERYQREDGQWVCEGCGRPAPSPEVAA